MLGRHCYTSAGAGATTPLRPCTHVAEQHATGGEGGSGSTWEEMILVLTCSTEVSRSLAMCLRASRNCEYDRRLLFCSLHCSQFQCEHGPFVSTARTCFGLHRSATIAACCGSSGTVHVTCLVEHETQMPTKTSRSAVAQPCTSHRGSTASCVVALAIAEACGDVRVVPHAVGGHACQGYAKEVAQGDRPCRR